MVHLPKITLFQGHLVLPGPFPVWVRAAFGTAALVLTAFILSAGILLLRDGTASAQTSSYAFATTNIMGYVNEWSPDRDPLVTLPGGVQAKSSNVYGVEVGGVRYFYQLTQSSSFDPLRAGKVSDYETIAVVDGGTPWEVLIYRLR